MADISIVRVRSYASLGATTWLVRGLDDSVRCHAFASRPCIALFPRKSCAYYSRGNDRMLLRVPSCFLLLSLLAACGGGESSTGPNGTPNVTVAVSPSNAVILT